MAATDIAQGIDHICFVSQLAAERQFVMVGA